MNVDPRECACCASSRRFEPWWPWELRLLKFFIIIIIIIITQFPVIVTTYFFLYGGVIYAIKEYKEKYRLETLEYTGVLESKVWSTIGKGNRCVQSLMSCSGNIPAAVTSDVRA